MKTGLRLFLLFVLTAGVAQSFAQEPPAPPVLDIFDGVPVPTPESDKDSEKYQPVTLDEVTINGLKFDWDDLKSWRLEFKKLDFIWTRHYFQQREDTSSVYGTLYVNSAESIIGKPEISSHNFLLESVKKGTMTIIEQTQNEGEIQSVFKINNEEGVGDLRVSQIGKLLETPAYTYLIYYEILLAEFPPALEKEWIKKLGQVKAVASK